ncbi:unnamed protein product [Calypogeia fissa]
MKALAKKASKEEKARQQEETAMVLVIEKLQELRALCIMKLKRQGRFFPEEDDQFVERVRAIVEEEEQQAAAARNTRVAAAAIRVQRKQDKLKQMLTQSLMIRLRVKREEDSKEEIETAQPTEKQNKLPKSCDGLPAEFYQYYFGSSFDMGTLIEVRQAWDAFIMPGGR